MSGLAWVGLGVCGAIGALARVGIATAIAQRARGPFPLGTLVVNLSGGLLLGILVGAGIGNGPMLVLGTGLLGAYTTFSTWMFETERLAQDEHRIMWLLYWLGPMLGGLLFTGLGWAIGGALW